MKLGLISEAQLQQVLSGQKKGAQRLEDMLIKAEIVTREQITETLSAKLKIPVVSCCECVISDEVKQLVPEELALSKTILPLEKRDSTLILAMADPLDYQTIDIVSFKTKLKVVPVLSDESELLRSIKTNYAASSAGPAPSVEGAAAAPPQPRKPFPAPAPSAKETPTAEGKGALDLLTESAALDKEISFLEKTQKQEESAAPSVDILYSKSTAPPIIKLVSMIGARAAQTRASDIHIEPREKYTQVRFRVDGELRNIFRYAKDIHESVVSRIKIISHLDITNRRLPQDGGASIEFQNEVIDLRISTAPSIYGEKIVVRLLDQSTGLLQFEELQMSGHVKESLHKILQRPQGMLIVTGPTGSGKTTTLYACLNLLRSEKRNIVTIEDPVEYRLDGITQIQIDESIGRTFSIILRSVLRQDPDIVKIGEIRDLETAEIAIKAALTGHFVLTTLHTNSTIATITRLLDIGIPPYLLSSAISGILSQRLIRKICTHCKIELGVSEEIGKLIETFSLPPITRHYQGAGCERCSHTGYAGRVAVYEYLPMTPKFRKALAKTVNEHEFLAEAKKSGFAFLFEDAWEKMTAGTTTYEEIIAKIPIEYRLRLDNNPPSEERRKKSDFAYYDELELG